MLGPHDWLEPDVRRQLEAVTAALASDFAGTFSPQTVARYVDDTLARWADASVQSYLPVLVRRFVADRLRALAQVKGRVGKDVPEVLFVCVRNAGRSQMAAALLARAADGAVGVRSAGSRPSDEVHPVVREVLAEIGIDLRGASPKYSAGRCVTVTHRERPCAALARRAERAYPEVVCKRGATRRAWMQGRSNASVFMPRGTKPLTDEVVSDADVVVSMGCGDACPVLPGKRYLRWDLPDPAERPLDEVRSIRDDIDHRVRALLAEFFPRSGVENTPR